MFRMDDLDDVMKNDNGTTFSRPICNNNFQLAYILVNVSFLLMFLFRLIFIRFQNVSLLCVTSRKQLRQALSMGTTSPQHKCHVNKHADNEFKQVDGYVIDCNHKQRQPTVLLNSELTSDH